MPNADWTSSTAKAAEAFPWSRIGLTSTISSEVITPASAIISMIEMGLPVVEPAFDRGAHARGDGRINRIEIEAHVHVVGSIGDPGQRLLHDPVGALAIDVGHGVDLHPGFLQPLLLPGVEAAYPDQRDVPGSTLGPEPPLR